MTLVISRIEEVMRIKSLLILWEIKKKQFIKLNNIK